MRYTIATFALAATAAAVPQYGYQAEESSSAPAYVASSSVPAYAASSSVPAYVASSSAPAYVASSSAPAYAASTPVYSASSVAYPVASSSAKYEEYPVSYHSEALTSIARKIMGGTLSEQALCNRIESLRTESSKHED